MLGLVSTSTHRSSRPILCPTTCLSDVLKTPLSPLSPRPLAGGFAELCCGAQDQSCPCRSVNGVGGQFDRIVAQKSLTIAATCSGASIGGTDSTDDSGPTVRESFGCPGGLLLSPHLVFRAGDHEYRHRKLAGQGSEIRTVEHDGMHCVVQPSTWRFQEAALTVSVGQPPPSSIACDRRALVTAPTSGLGPNSRYRATSGTIRLRSCRLNPGRGEARAVRDRTSDGCLAATRIPT